MNSSLTVFFFPYCQPLWVPLECHSAGTTEDGVRKAHPELDLTELESQPCHMTSVLFVFLCLIFLSCKMEIAILSISWVVILNLTNIKHSNSAWQRSKYSVNIFFVTFSNKCAFLSLQSGNLFFFKCFCHNLILSFRSFVHLSCLPIFLWPPYVWRWYFIWTGIVACCKS